MRISVAVFTAWTLLFALFAGATAFADTVELKSGEKLEGVILEKDDYKIVLQHDVLGRIEIPTTEIKKPEKKPEKPGLFGTWFLRGWNKSLAAGASGSSGKSNEVNANVDLNLNRETERHRMQYVARYNFVRASHDTTEDAFDTRYTHDFLFPPSAWFPFLTASYRLDTQQEYLHRLGANAGVGYEFIKSDEWEVIGRAGGGIAQTLDDRRNDTTQGKDPVRTEPNALAGLQALWNYHEGQSLSANTLYLLDLADAPNYRSESRAEWKLAVGFVEGMAFKLGTSFIYDSHEVDKFKRELRYYANLVYDF